MRLVLLVAAALVGFAANSLLTRAALGAGTIDPAAFMAVRLVSGALALAILVRATGAPRAAPSWIAALALAGYAVFFTFAYTRIGAGVGALVLFGSVQVTMIAAGLASGERPRAVDWAGVALAVAGLVVLTLPGAAAPDPLGAVLMAAGGACWGLYSLRGRSSAHPLAATSVNFARAALIAAAIAALDVARRGGGHAEPSGLWLAAASGALASGVGYTFWYSALPSLASWHAAVLQLLVPVLTAGAATVILNESMSTRLVTAAALILGGIAATVLGRRGR